MQETLYPGLEFSSLNWLEKQWAAWYIWIANPVIATGLMSFLLHEVGTAYSPTQSVIERDCVYRLCTLAVACHGLLSTPFPTSASGNYSPVKCLRLKNNGNAQSKYCSRILPSSCLP